jgi:predicted MFS family arabinose efflux permease
VNNSQKTGLKQALIYSGLGLQMLGFISLGAFLGHYLDSRWHTEVASPICILIFVLLSIAYVAKKLSKP